MQHNQSKIYAAPPGCEVDDLDDGHDETRRYKSLSHGPMPATIEASGMEAAITIALESTTKWHAEDQDGYIRSVCVIASSHLVRDAFARQFGAVGHMTSVIDANKNLAADGGVIHFATMHRAKGLEFDRVIVVAPSSYFGLPSETDAQRKLIYVALTRAKRDAVLLKV